MWLQHQQNERLLSLKHHVNLITLLTCVGETISICRLTWWFIHTEITTYDHLCSFLNQWEPLAISPHHIKERSPFKYTTYVTLLSTIERLSLTIRGLTLTAKMKLLPSVFSSLNSRVKIFVFVANSRWQFLFLCDLMKEQQKRSQIQRSSLPFAVWRKTT